MGTIVQPYGPIYGEVVNGTVQGRPNGSVYVPLSNIIDLDLGSLTTFYNRVAGGNTYIHITAAAKISASSQDLANYVQSQVYADSDCTILLGYYNSTAGLFNFNSGLDFVKYSADATPLDPDDIGYFRVQLFSSTGYPVATSDVVPLTCVVAP